MAIGIENTIVDLLILYIPIPTIMTLNLSRPKKNGVLVIFLTGSMYVNSSEARKFDRWRYYRAIVADAVVMYYRVRLYKQIDPMRDGMIVGLCR